jgi:hypothetical protein
MKRPQWGVAFAAACFALVLLSGCRGGGAAVSVQIQPGTTISIDEGQSTNFTATVANDIHNQGVTWSLTQTTSTVCSGAGCGTLKNVTNSSVTYVAPSNLTAGESVTLTAASAATPNATTTATISVVLAPVFSSTTFPNGSTNGAPFTLPNAANGVPYNQTITVTGGVTPLAFSLQSGSSLPAGLTLNSSGTIVGKPSVPAVGQPTIQTSVTVVATDNGTPPVSVSQAFTLSVTAPPLLSISTTSLSAGLSNSKYTASVSALGGVTPVTWSVISGSLPPGLAVSPTSGQITGTIPAGTTAQAYPFTVQAQDSTLPSGQKAQQALSITVQQPAPVAVSTTTLPSGTTATGYNASLQATGGIPPYTWSITSGQLPSGLTLAPNGTISGVPVIVTTSPDNITVLVQDSEANPVPASQASQSLSITITAGSGSNNSLVSGSYSFLFNGFDSGGSVAIAGSITTDGNGNITGGLEDSNRLSNGAAQVVVGIPLTGTYSLGSDGRGTMQLIATNPSTQVKLTTDYRIVLDSSGNIHFIQNNDITTVGVGTDTLGTHGEGILKPVLGTFNSASFNGNYAFLFSGQDMSGKPAALAGAINANGSSTIIPAAGGVSSDFNDNGTFSTQNVSGQFSVGSSNNRGAAQFLFEIPGKSQNVLQFAFYFVSASDIYFVELDTTATELTPVFYRLSGEMILQSTGVAFVNTSLSGASVVTGTGLSGSNASVLAGLFTGTATSAGGGTATLTYDENSGGTITSPSPSFPSGGYAIANNGRAAFTGFGTPSRVAVAYLTGPGQGFVLGNDAAVTTGLLEQQSTGISFSNSTVQGGYTLGTSPPAETKVPNLIGQVSGDGAGGILGTVDEIDPPTISAPVAPEGTPHLNQSLNAHINFIGTNGRGTATTNSPTGFPATLVLYVVSPAHFRAISADSNPGNGHPDVLFFDH